MMLVPTLAAAAPAAADPVRILAFGDSLTAGFGLPQGDGFTAQLEAALAEAGVEAEVINGGVSGDTTAGGFARLDWALADDPDLVILELGANDGLRGLDPAETRANLDAILTRLREADVAVLLAGMLAPPNLGPEFGKAFNAIYPDLAEEHDVALFPFFLDGVATDPALNQPDGIHPNRGGVAVIVERILPHLLPVIESLDRRAPKGQS
ncbi:arylesterase [Virgifigura deserti]|uniref:arylesterase n=1 Tax=Virgifigura deserti TaxID=2268457 RepID=UPI003CCC1A94